MNAFGWMSAHTIGDAAAAASTTVTDAMVSGETGRGKPAIVKAGGIDLLDLIKENLLAPATLVSLSSVPGLDGITQEAGGVLRIGAMVRLAQLGKDADVRRLYPALADAVGASASPQIRNVATIGGNLLQRPRCWYFRSEEHHCLRKGGVHCFALSGDNRYHAIFANRPCAIVHPSTAATVLVALGATVELAGSRGAPRQLPLEKFFVSSEQDPHRENGLQPREILTAVRLPALAPGVRMAHLKQGEKASFDWPLADVAVVLDLTDDHHCRSASVILGAAAPVPHRAKLAESTLVGKRVDEDVARQAAHAALDGATPLAGNAYKLPLFETLVRRAILRAVNSGASA